MAEINVVPYIDVTLVLLIIFMVTAPLLQTGVDVDLPQAEARTVDPQQDLPIIVSIDAEGRLFVDAGNEEDVEVDSDELNVRVMDALRRKPGLPVLIRGDRTVDYGKVVIVMASLKNAGVPSVGLMTSPVRDE
ncbi:tolR protein [Methylocaldum marinum]|uniref:TolR protein n=2 Tax=Methylocaldum marinum TaxID=1432792 RepID=A0A250L0E8_9GAMM|nr:tolR protein [Methylocaldum marinum]